MRNVIVFLIFLIVGLLSCKKVIKVDLNSAAPRIVIDGSLSNQPGPYSVKLSKSINFDQANNFPAISGAKVVIGDNNNYSETLIESTPGTYRTNQLIGTPGRTYILTVTSEGSVYQSVSYLPPPIEIKTLSVDIGFDKDKRINVAYEDPAGFTNYYRCVEIVNGLELPDISVESDQFKDGQTVIQTISNDISKYKLKTGDKVTVLLQTIDKGTYDYYRTLNNILLQDGGGGPPPTAPTNPISSFTNNGLGNFNTYSVTQKAIIVP
jgi:hypothetical protein